MNNIVSSNIDEVIKLLKSHRIERAYIFGSAVQGDFNEQSDLDSLAKFEGNITPLEKGELWWNLHDTL